MRTILMPFFLQQYTMVASLLWIPYHSCAGLGGMLNLTALMLKRLRERPPLQIGSMTRFSLRRLTRAPALPPSFCTPIVRVTSRLVTSTETPLPHHWASPTGRYLFSARHPILCTPSAKFSRIARSRVIWNLCRFLSTSWWRKDAMAYSPSWRKISLRPTSLAFQKQVLLYMGEMC